MQSITTTDNMQDAIKFGEWILKSDYIKACQKYYRKVGTDIFKTPAELYKQFKKSNKK